MATESFFSNASLAYLASAGAGKDGKTYSIKPTDGTGDFTFSRGSNLTATRVGPTGLIEKGRENLLLRSNQFDTTWTTSNASVTSGQSGYDGTSDAWLLSKSGANGRILQSSISTSGVSTFSVYAKANNSNYIVIQFQSTFAYFDLTTGLAQNETIGIISATSTDEGNGWFRCSIVFNISASSTAYIYPAEDGSVGGTSGSIYIQDAQLEVGLAATDYIESGASTGKAGLLENEPRFDYSGGAPCPSLLLEPSRTNLIGQSEYFDSWDKIGSPIITNNYGISPEGLQNSTRLQTTSDRISISVGTINANETFSIYMKGSGTLRIDLGGTNNFYPTLTSEWVRYEFITTQAGSNTNIQIRGNGSAVDVELYGAQLEEGSYPTSYIPNHSGGSATRSIDIISKDLTSVINNNQMTMFVDVKSLTSITTVIAANNFGDLRWYHLPANTFRFYKMDDATWITNSFVVNEGDKIALTLTDTQAKLFVNGAQVGTTFTLTTSFQNFSNLNYNVGSSKNEWNQLLFFSTPLSDADCITLTT